MKLQEFYYTSKSEQGFSMPILLPSGEQSGETFTVLGSMSDDAIKAATVYQRLSAKLFLDNEPLRKKCEKAGNFEEYNDLIVPKIDDLNIVYASSLIIGWSFDEEFTHGALLKLLGEYKGLAKAVCDFFAQLKLDSAKK